MVARAEITIADLNDPIAQGTAPVNPTLNMLWLDTGISPNLLKRWNGREWVIVNDTSALNQRITDAE